MSAPIPAIRLDLLDRLTVVELDIASRKLKEDIVHAITAPTAGRWQGLAILAWMVGKKTDPTYALKPLLALDAADLCRELARLAGDEAVLDELEEAEAELEALRARAEAVDDVELELAEAAQAVETAEKKVESSTSSVSANESSAEAVANPTPPPSVSSSPGRGAPIPAGSPR